MKWAPNTAVVGVNRIITAEPCRLSVEKQKNTRRLIAGWVEVRIRYMYFRHIFVLVVILFGFFSQSNYAQNVDEIVQKMKQGFDGISSIHSEVKIEKTLELPYREFAASVDPTLPTKWTFEYWAKGKYYNYQLTSQTKGKEGFVAREALASGTDDLTQYLSKKADGLMVIQLSRKPTSKYWLTTENATFATYAFLYSGSDVKADFIPTIPSLSDLQAPKTWEQFANNPTLHLTSSNGDIISLTVNLKENGPVIPYHESQYTYVIRLSKRLNYFPVGYKKINGAGVTVLQVSCVDVIQTKHDNNAIFLSPKKVISKGYNRSGQLLLTVSSVMESIGINTLADYSSSLFDIDPAIADVIEDIDQNKFIQVPR